MRVSSEASLWALIRPSLQRLGDVMRVENSCHPGTPDVNVYIPGLGDMWLELKHADGWPQRASTPLRLSHYTLDQRRWLQRRAQAGGRVALLLRVGREILIFQWPHTEQVGNLTQSELSSMAGLHLPCWDETSFRRWVRRLK